MKNSSQYDWKLSLEILSFTTRNPGIERNKKYRNKFLLSSKESIAKAKTKSKDTNIVEFESRPKKVASSIN